LAILGELHAKGVDLYLHQQGVDTSTPAGKAHSESYGRALKAGLIVMAVFADRIAPYSYDASVPGSRKKPPSVRFMCRDESGFSYRGITRGPLSAARHRGQLVQVALTGVIPRAAYSLRCRRL